MRREIRLAVILAGFSGLIAAAAVVSWLDMLSEQNKPAETVQQSLSLSGVVVAKQDIEFGTVLSSDLLTVTEWPSANTPPGSFNTIEKMFEEDRQRMVLIGLKAGEPILDHKITGPGRRATLAAMLSEGKKAVSIRVNDVVGVGGFVVPGDRVDVLLTRKTNDNADAQIQEVYTDLLLQNVRVLATDQSADPKESTPKISRTVTVEVSIRDAQKIALASSIGELSLVLSDSGPNAEPVRATRMTVAGLTGDSGEKKPRAVFLPSNGVAPPPAPVSGDGGSTVKVKVVRTIDPTEYSVVRRSADE